MKSFKLAAVGLVAMLVIVLIAQNTQVTDTRLLLFTVTMPQAALLAITLLLGIVLGLVIAARFRTSLPGTTAPARTGETTRAGASPS